MKSRLFIGFSLILILAGAKPCRERERKHSLYSPKARLCLQHLRGQATFSLICFLKPYFVLAHILLTWLCGEQDAGKFKLY